MPRLRNSLFATTLVMSAIAAAITLLSAGCGGGDGESEVDCQTHADCDEACLGGECVGAPEMGQQCPDEHAGEVYDGLECIDGVWQIDGLELAIYNQPPPEVVAGESFSVEVKLVDADAQRVEMEGVEITLAVEQVEFAGGDSQITATTEEWGVATFTAVIDTAGEDYRLEASADEVELEQGVVTTDNFDVVAAAAHAETSTIYGEADHVDIGEEVTVFIELFDPFHNPVPGVVPQFEATGEGNEYDECSETDDDGIATCSMTATEVGFQTLRITEPVEVTGDTIDFQLPCSEANSPFGGGDGSAQDPYRLCAPHHVSSIGFDTANLDRQYVMTRDIDMGGVQDFSPIGDQSNFFDGVFDGAGRTLSNVTIDAGGQDYVGLFRTLGGDGSAVKSLTLEDVDIAGDAIVGALAGIVGNNDDEVVVDVHASGEVAGVDTVGGLVGQLAYTSIQHSSADTTVILDGEVGGGLVGEMYNGEISDSRADGDVVGAEDNIGGLVGFGIGELQNVHATGAVDGGDNVGGLVGIMAGDVEASSAIGDVSGGDHVGGLIGEAGGLQDITQSYAAGDVEGDVQVGGLIGIQQAGVIADCYAVGDVDGVSWTAGGLVGWNGAEAGEDLGDDALDVFNSYAAGDVGDGDALFGYYSSSTSGDVSGVYWDIETTGSDSEPVGTGLTSSEFDNEANFEDWDFDDIWQIDTAPDGHQRPVLQWQ